MTTTLLSIENEFWCVFNDMKINISIKKLAMFQFIKIEIEICFNFYCKM